MRSLPRRCCGRCDPRAVLEAKVKWARGEEALEAKAREARAAEEAGRGGAGSGARGGA